MDRLTDPGDYLQAAEFAVLESIRAERVLGRITSSYYQGGRYGDTWYVHKFELAAGKS